ARRGYPPPPAGPAGADAPVARKQGGLGRAVRRAEGQDLRRLSGREPRGMAPAARARGGKLRAPGPRRYCWVGEGGAFSSTSVACQKFLPTKMMTTRSITITTTTTPARALRRGLGWSG